MAATSSATLSLLARPEALSSATVREISRRATYRHFDPGPPLTVADSY